MGTIEDHDLLIELRADSKYIREQIECINDLQKTATRNVERLDNLEERVKKVEDNFDIAKWVGGAAFFIASALGIKF